MYVKVLTLLIHSDSHQSNRDSKFPYLSAAEKDKLGGVEYREICLLSIIVPVYFVLWQFLGAIVVGASIAMNHASVTETNGLNPWLVFVS
jgi:Cation transport protein